MWYYEQSDFSGKCRPRTSTSRPETNTRRNGQKKIRAVSRVAAMHEDLSLEELQAIYSDEMRQEVAE